MGYPHFDGREMCERIASAEITLRQTSIKSFRKEVIQPQVPLRLPCYDLVPVTSLAVGTPETGPLRALPAPMT